MTIEVRLTNIRYGARDVNLYEFMRPDGSPLPAVEPGAHIDVRLPNAITRQYSLVEAGDAPRVYVIGVKRDPGSRGGSSFMHEQLRVGTILEISTPRNHFPLNETASLTILFAGGIGVTPIYCMVQRLANIGRAFRLYCSSRSREEAVFLKELGMRAETTFHFDEESNGQYLDLKGIIAAAPSDAHLYCCGPLPMLRTFEKAAKHFPAEQVHVEYFTAATEAATEGGYVVELARSKREFFIPEGHTILQVLRQAGVDAAYSCEGGICGACEVPVISGQPDHRDSVLTESERARSKTMMICCSGSKGPRLVLDLE